MEELIIDYINNSDLHNIKRTLNIHNITYEYFIYACIKGNIKIAQWLYEIKSDIDISKDNEYAFRYACCNGHIDIAKWLLEIKPNIDISANNHFVFIYACYNQKIKLAQWLCTLYGNYYLGLENNRITKWKIKNELEYLLEINNKENIVKKLQLNLINVKDSCLICLNDELDEYIQTNCNHIYCYDCYIHWYYIEKNNKKCCYCSLRFV